MPMTPKSPILLVEDDRGHSRLIERALQRARIAHDIVTIDDGQDALDYLLKQGAYANAQHDLPLIAMLDMQLPSLDGIQVLKRLKADNRTKDLPVLMMSSTESFEEMRQCATLGCGVYLVKPIESTAFFEAVRSLGVCVAVEVIS